MKLEQVEIEIIAKSVGISAGIAAAIPVVWLLLKVIAGMLPVFGWVVLFFVALILWTAAFPWLLFFNDSFVMEYWIWFSALDCVIAGLVWGMWMAHKHRRANARRDSGASNSPF
jgi:hypothetical protein